MITTETNLIVERIYPNDTRVKPQTVQHHVARYEFARDLPNMKNEALDIGCGTGYGVNVLKEEYIEVTGIDQNAEAIDFAQKTFPQNNYEQANILKWDLTGHNPNLVTFFEVIEHLTYKEGIAVIGKYRNILKPGGLFLISTPRDNNSKYNQFHKSQWDYATLKNNLSDLFSQVTMYGQDWDTGKITLEQPMTDDFFIAVARK